MKNSGGTFINYTYARLGHDSWLSCFPTQFNSIPEESESWYQSHPSKITGHIQHVDEGLSYRITDQVLTADKDYLNEPCDDFNLIIYFYQFHFEGKMSFEIGKTFIENEGPDYRAVMMTNSRVAQKLSLKKGCAVKGLAIMISESWIEKNLRNIDSSNYQQLTGNELILDYLTAKHQKILNDLFEGLKTAHLPGLYATSRVMRLLGGFLENLFAREVAEIKESITPKDFQSVLKIETLLVQSYDEGFPKIENLARLALMSESKLKKLYKRAFGMGLYEYYQKNRMHKAKELLHSGKYTVSQVGSMLGYQNLSNFSASFKKEFNHSPSDFMQVG